MKADLEKFLDGSTIEAVSKVLIVLIAAAAVGLVYRFVTRALAAHVLKTGSRGDDFVIEVLRMPFLLLLVWIALRIITLTVLPGFGQSATVVHGMRLLLIATVGWILIKLTRVMFYYIEKRVDERTRNQYESRSSMTKLTIFERMIVAAIVVVAIAAGLMTFDQIRTVGLSLLTSAGIAGIIVGFAAQKSLSMMLAGIQIAITQPIKLNDLVVINGQNGRVEEINLTYVVVKLWNKKRVVLPVTYFLEQPFENWTRDSSDILGTFTFNVDYRMPLDAVRTRLRALVQGRKDWDGETCSLDIDQMNEHALQLKVTLGSGDSDASNALITYVRENLLAFLQSRYPEYFVRYRVEEQVVSGTLPDPAAGTAESDPLPVAGGPPAANRV